MTYYLYILYSQIIVVYRKTRVNCKKKNTTKFHVRLYIHTQYNYTVDFLQITGVERTYIFRISSTEHVDLLNLKHQGTWSFSNSKLNVMLFVVHAVDEMAI